jgi:hypothetical protein
MNWTNLASVVPVIVVGYALMVTVLFFLRIGCCTKIIFQRASMDQQCRSPY